MVVAMPSIAPGYDAKERARHSGALQVKVTQELAVKTVDQLCKLKGLPPIKVVFHARRGQGGGATSWYTTGHHKNGEHISIEHGMLNYLVVVHEWAHYAHRRQYLGKKKIDANHRRERWHGVEHRVLVDEGIAFLKKQGVLAKVKPLPDSVADLVARALGELDPRTLDADARHIVVKTVSAAFLKTLPARAVCPRCSQELRREAFGTRVLRKDPNGLPQLMGRQSYCQPCRRKPLDKGAETEI